ncbi:C-5 cytosine-specific DNA methylase [Onchocerca flexuosa]|uniref:C-5 cytosine-specific DNA methylase n=1 Tax=Onchocerca flexuosa TaxID=387005 RepID=A0A238C4H3_9BILA|nr:C-5 cytosine-specific DNA methylase [Onchocerca flexuosa]
MFGKQQSTSFLCAKIDSNDKPMKCLEFFAGIGGFHYALKEIGLQVIIRALDINTVTNAIYKHNFPNTEIQQCNIEKLRTDYYDDYNADIWTLSPPCQPFTKKGLRKDLADRRCIALKSICNVLKTMKHRPRYIIVENVCGFETSEAHQMLKDTLMNLCYSFEEYIISPTEIGIPNSRPRYYLLANLTSEYLCDKANEDISLAILPEKVERFGNVMSFVIPDSLHSSCFTKSYYRYIAGTGPILLQFSNIIQDRELSSEQLRNFALHDNCKNLMHCQIRYFSWREIANLLGFPRTFEKPPNISTKQMYHALGNSISVSGVALLIQHLLKI